MAGASLGEPYLFTSGLHARLGDPSMFPLPERDQEPQAASMVPHDAQLAVLTLTVRDLTEAVEALRTETRRLTLRLDRAPWYVRLWRWVTAWWDDTGEG